MMDMETLMTATRAAKKQLKKCGVDAKYVRISPQAYTYLTGESVIKCGRINGMDMYIDFSICKDYVITGDANG